jgi:DNA-binding response OmpR family regulator
MSKVVYKPTALLICNDDEVIDDIQTAFSFCKTEVNLKTIKSSSAMATSIVNFVPNVIIFDLDGYEVGIKGLKNIKNLSNAILVTLSYFADEKSTVQALEQGANDHIIKPIRPMEFVARLRSLLSIKQQVSERKWQ